MSASRTPIEHARNLGPTSAAELQAVGIGSLEHLKEIGWAEAFIRLVRVSPHRLNLNMCCALIGAVEDVDWRKVPTSEKMAARQLMDDLKRVARR